MGWWSDHVVPRLVDKALSTQDIPPLRDRVCAGLSGAVVELGFGSGLNLAHYPEAVREVFAVEPSDVAWRMAQPRLDVTGVRAVRAGLDGEQLTLPTASFDAVLSTFTMCTIPDLDVALGEVTRVLKPGGLLHFLEHGRAPHASVARWQNRLQPIQRRVAGGWHLARPIDEHVRGSGLVLEELETFYGAGPKPTSYLYLGRARKLD